MISHIVPEARVLSHPIFAREESVSGPSSNSWGQVGESSHDLTKTACQDDGLSSDTEDSERYLPASIHEKALSLLKAIQANAPEDVRGERSEILLAGHGFGGLVIKKAIIIANTDPKYYNIAYDVSKLVFFSTPHREGRKRGWEGVLLDMIEAQDLRFIGRLSQVLSTLVHSVSQLSHVFHKFATKYQIANFVEELGTDTSTPIIGELGSLNNDFETVELRQQKNYKTVLDINISELFRHLRLETYAKIKRTYFEALRTLSNSRWIIYEPRTLESYEDFVTLQEVYGSLLDGTDSDVVLNSGFIQVVGATGHGKSVLLQLISQKLRQRFSVTTLDTHSPPSDVIPTRYSILASFIHQIISQQPMCFHRVRETMAELLLRDAWSEESVRTMFSLLISSYEGTIFLVVIYNHDHWPEELRLWVSQELQPLFKSCGSKFLFLTSSQEPIETSNFPESHKVNVDKEYEKYRQRLICVKLKGLLDQGYGSLSGHGRTADMRRKIIEAATVFEGSFSATVEYLMGLFQQFSLTTAEVIEGCTEASSKAEEALYHEEILALRRKHPNILFWALSAISWLVSSVRPLRLEELAAATAVKEEDDSFEDIQDRVSLDMAQDLKRHLSHLAAVEGNQGYIASPVAQRLLTSTSVELGLYCDKTLAKLCLKYLRLILPETDHATDINLRKEEDIHSELSARTSTAAVSDNADRGCYELGHEFLDYACRFWPEHLLRAEALDKDLKDEVTSFLLAPQGRRWFSFYLFYHGQVTDPVGKAQELEDEIGLLQGLSNEKSARQSAVRMACYVGLNPMELEQLGPFTQTDKIIRLNTRRGYSEKALTLMNVSSEYCLDCAISNDDADVTKTLVETSYTELTTGRALHKAALFGSVKTSRMLLRLLDENPENDEIEKTVLHMAATGGSISVLHLLLGSHASEKQPAQTKIASMIDIKDTNEQTPLIIASGADISIQDSTGKTALHYAIVMCSAIVEELITPELAGIPDNDGFTPLHISAMSGSLLATKAITIALQHQGRFKEMMNFEDRSGKTPLQYAAQEGFTEIVQLLLRHKNVVEQEPIRSAANLAAVHGNLGAMSLLISKANESVKSQILIAAAGAGQLLVVQYLLRGGDRVLANIDDKGRWPLCEAAARGHTEIVHLLLKSKASVGVADEKRRTPLHHAAENGMAKVCQVLLQQRPDVDAADVDRKTPLHFAAAKGNVDVVRLLVMEKANVEGVSRTRQTPLHLAVRNPDVVKLLLDHGATPNATDSLKQTPLHLAVSCKSLQSVQHLLAKKASITALDDEGRSPLYYAIEKEELEIVKEICKHREGECNLLTELLWAVEFAVFPIFQYLLDLDSSKASEPELLHKAAGAESEEILDLILKSGIGTNLKWKDKSALHAAASNGRVENINILLKHGSDVDAINQIMQTPLHIAALEGHAEAVETLLEAGAELNVRDKYSQSPVYFAAYQGHVDVMIKILKHNPDIKISEEQDGWFPVHAGADDLDITRILVEYGADPNQRGGDGITPFIVAAAWGNLSVVEYLSEKGGDATLHTENGVTALHIAVDRNDIGMVKTLIGLGAGQCIDKQAVDGQTPLHVALESSECDIDMIKLLIDTGADSKLPMDDKTPNLALAVNSLRLDKIEWLLSMSSEPRLDFEWPLDDLISAYWRTLSLYCRDVTSNKDMTASVYPDIIRMFIRKSPRLISTVSPVENVNALEMCLWKPGKRGQEEKFAINLLKLADDPGIGTGFNPLQRRGSNRSALELGVISRRVIKKDFIKQCVEYIPSNIEDAKALGLGFKELRIATELDEPDMWKRLEPLVEQYRECTDDDGWNIDHYLHQIAGRVTLAEKAKLPSFASCKTPQRVLFPFDWAPEDSDSGKRFTIDDDGLGVNLFLRKNNPIFRFISLRADYPLTPRPASSAEDHIRYFEVRISSETPYTEDESESANSDDDGQKSGSAVSSKEVSNKELPFAIGIGLCGEFTDLTNAMTGWNPWTVGYHGDDGLFRLQDSQIGGDPVEGIPKCKFGKGDVVGCGINYSSNEYFFTCNGKVVGKSTLFLP
ncbi:putative ankyrin repeat protein [Fusarium austroafricanum]|uniref:Putative ankyrin repeat protein n=1 Tax=Fusarium austroafricanum TaxID=2364996 RepID=A0A8H4NV70_9HYPO|nr:putative ankyrin repeat protein [Fusarium austroafricanum]